VSLPRVRVPFGGYLAGIRHTLCRPSEERERLPRIERRAEPCRLEVTRDDCSDPRYLATAQSVLSMVPKLCRTGSTGGRPTADGGTSGKPLNRWQPARTPGSGSGREDYRIPRVNGRLAIRMHRRDQAETDHIVHPPSARMGDHLHRSNFRDAESPTSGPASSKFCTRVQNLHPPGDFARKRAAAKPVLLRGHAEWAGRLCELAT